MASTLLQCTMRDFVLCGLCNGAVVQFFRVTPRSDGTIYVEMTPVYNLAGEGGKRLTWILHASPAELGMKLYNVKVGDTEVEINGVLGRGGNSIVYKGSYNDAKV
jgi:hypothetical protein